MSTLQHRLDVATAIMAEAVPKAQSLFEARARFAMEEKNPSEFVSEADRAVEDLIRQRLMAALPDDAVMGEERGGATGTAFWSIDPIDGTANFLRGSPLWGISLGYVVDGRSSVGVIAFPTLGITLSAALGLGVWRNQLRFRRHVPFPGVRVASVGESPRWSPEGIAGVERALRRAGWGVAEYRCATIGLGFAALGLTDGYIERNLSIWDLAAGAVICAEAGLTVRYDGTYEAAGMSIVAAIDAVHAVIGDIAEIE